MALEWLKPEIIFGSILYALMGVVIFWIVIVIVVLLLFRCGSGGGTSDCNETRNIYGEASQEYQSCLINQRSGGGGFRTGGGAFGGFSSGGGHK